MNAFVTGGSGFIGRHLIDILLKEGNVVHALCRRPFRPASAGQGNFFTHQGDLQNPDSLAAAMTGCTHLFHLAGYARNWARDSSVYRAVNVDGTTSVLQAARNAGVRRAVVTSSVLALGFADGHPVSEEQPTDGPLPTPYAESKRGAERAALAMNAPEFEVVVVNPTRVYGPGLMTEGNSATRMIKLHLRGLWPLILGDGSAVGNYAHVRDVACGHLLAMEFGKAGERYILGGENASFRRFFAEVQELSGTTHRLLSTPAALAITIARIEEFRARHLMGYPAITPGWVRTFLEDGSCSVEKAKRELQYVVTPLREGLRETIGWLARGEPAVV